MYVEIVIFLERWYILKNPCPCSLFDRKKDRKKKSLDGVYPEYQIEWMDSDEVRRKIISIPYSQWKKRGFSKGTLNYMKKNAKGYKQFTLNRHVRERFNQWEKWQI